MKGDQSRTPTRATGLQLQLATIVLDRLADLEMTQVELGKRLGWSQKHISQVLKGEAMTSLQSWEFMAFVLGIELEITFSPSTPPWESNQPTEER